MCKIFVVNLGLEKFCKNSLRVKIFKSQKCTNEKNFNTSILHVRCFSTGILHVNFSHIYM